MKMYLRAALFVCAIISASNAEEKALFAHPNAVFVTQGPRNTRFRDRVFNDSRELPANANPIVRVSGGTSLPEKNRSFGGMFWKFISSTEFGDIYLMIYEAPTGKKEAISVLFNGSTDIVFKRGDWVLTITNKSA